MPCMSQPLLPILLGPKTCNVFSNTNWTKPNGFLFAFIWFCWDRTSLYRPGWPGIQHVLQVGLELTVILFLASQMFDSRHESPYRAEWVLKCQFTLHPSFPVSSEHPFCLEFCKKKKKNQASAMPTLFRKFQYFLKCQRKLGKGDFTKRKLTSNLRMGFWMKSLILFLSHWKEKPCSFSTGKWWAGICPQSSSNIILTSSDMAKPQIARVEPRPDPRPLIPTQCFAAAFLTLNKNSISLFNKHNTIVRTKWLKKKIPVSLNLCLLESTLPHTSPQTRLDSSFLVQSCFLHHSSYASNISYLLVYMWVHPLVL